jgi:hypothetical protein
MDSLIGIHVPKIMGELYTMHFALATENLGISKHKAIGNANILSQRFCVRILGKMLILRYFMVKHC